MVDFARIGPGFWGDNGRMSERASGTVTATTPEISASNASHSSDLAKGGGNVSELLISGEPVLTGQDGVAYAGFTVTAGGGTPPYTYDLVGTWPTGITINSDGEVSGTPSEDGTFADLSVSATDGASDVAQLDAFTLVIDPA